VTSSQSSTQDVALVDYEQPLLYHVKMPGNRFGTKLQNRLSYLKKIMIRVKRTLKRLKHDVDSRMDET
jgi:hypothetical protein